MSFYKFSRFLAKIVLKSFFKFKIHGIENIPDNGRLIICSNHINLLDPPVLGVAINRQISFMAKKELFKNKLLSFIVSRLGAFPVNREGNDIRAIKNALKVLKNGNVLGIFPEGTRVKDFDLDNAKAGVAMIAIKSKTPIIPILIKSNYKLFSKIDIFIGSPIEFNEYYDKKLNANEYIEISKIILKEIYKLDKI